jgi:hypothetical protein
LCFGNLVTSKSLFLSFGRDAAQLRQAKSRVEDLQQRLKRRILAHIPTLCILGLAMFSLGVAKAYNWKIGVFVFIILATICEIGHRLFQKIFNSREPAPIEGPDRFPARSLDSFSDNHGKKIA